MFNYDIVKDMFLDLEKQGLSDYIYKLGIMENIMNYVSNSDLFPQFVEMNNEQMLNDNRFYRIVDIVYNEFISMDYEYNIDNVIEQLVEEGRI